MPKHKGKSGKAGMGNGTGKRKGNAGKSIGMKGVKSRSGKTRMPADRMF